MTAEMVSPAAARRTMLVVQDLTIEYTSPESTTRAVDGVSFELAAGETLGIVGESGSGKSTLGLSLLGLSEATGGVVRNGRISLDGVEMVGLPDKQLSALRGQAVSMVFQDPMSSFNPVWSLGSQITETIRAHDPGVTRAAARDRAKSLLRRVGLGHVNLDSLPREFSGGMLQRAMIAVAIANDPRLIVADEPVTALDVTVQAQILDLFAALLEETDAALILVTHDLGVIAELVDKVMVMYGGRGVEFAGVYEIFAEPRHPYTRALLESRPTIVAGQGRRKLPVIPGAPVNPANMPPGCSFHPRCALSTGRARCEEERPALRESGPGRFAACHFSAEMALQQ
jgi:oligopeptide/dipeptide ABC transporter ATP-binding protein